MGHQGGILIPKGLDEFFPQLAPLVTTANPSQEKFIVADLYDGPSFLETVETRYQFQTWGGTRSPERRITRNLTALRNRAVRDDVLLIYRSVFNDNYFKLVLIRQSSPEYVTILEKANGRRSGPLDTISLPVKEEEVQAQENEMAERAADPFQLFEADPHIIETRQKRIARARAFQKYVSNAYQYKCVVCRSALVHPLGKNETQSAHIVPRGRRGIDDVRNGIQLCRTHHWAFDAGLFTVMENYRIFVPDNIRNVAHNAALSALNNVEIMLPQEAILYPHPEALAWHCQNILYTL